MLFVSEASIVGNTILKGHMHRYEWSRDIDSGTAATRKAPLVNERYRRSRNRLFFWPKNPAHTNNPYTEKYIYCYFTTFLVVDWLLRLVVPLRHWGGTGTLP